MVVLRANVATARLLGVTAFPLFSKISSEFCVNLLICPQVGILFQVVDGRGMLCLFQTQILETHYWGGSMSYAKHPSVGVHS